MEISRQKGVTWLVRGEHQTSIARSAYGSIESRYESGSRALSRRLPYRESQIDQRARRSATTSPNRAAFSQRLFMAMMQSLKKKEAYLLPW
jgi:hypothetical protein